MGTYPRWVGTTGDGWCLFLTKTDHALGLVLHAAAVCGYGRDMYGFDVVKWSTGSVRDHADDLPSAADAAEASLRKDGVLPPDASVWRPVELRGPVWLTCADGPSTAVATKWPGEAEARAVATRPGVRLLRAVEVES